MLDLCLVMLFRLKRIIKYPGCSWRTFLRESSFNITRRGMKISRGAPKILRHPKGGALKKLGGGAPKFVYFKANRRVGWGGGGLLKKMNC